MSEAERLQAGPGGGWRTVRWLLVLPAGVIGWQVGTTLGGTLVDLLQSACSAPGGTTGACGSELAPILEEIAWQTGMAVAAGLMVLLPVLAAPSMRGAIAWSAYGMGVAVAGQHAWMAGAWLEVPVTALVGLVVLLLVLRRWRADLRAAVNTRDDSAEDER